MYERRDSNSHRLPYWNLNPARLPIPPLSRVDNSEISSHCASQIYQYHTHMSNPKQSIYKINTPQTNIIKTKITKHRLNRSKPIQPTQNATSGKAHKTLVKDVLIMYSVMIQDKTQVKCVNNLTEQRHARKTLKARSKNT